MQIKQINNAKQCWQPIRSEPIKTTNKPNKMKYEVTIKGTLPTTLNEFKSEDCIKLACDCIEATILDTSLAYQSVDASYIDDGDLDITIRKIIRRAKPLIVGEIVEEELQIIDKELIHSLSVIPFTLQLHLKHLIITDVKAVSED